jgi:hypothetical protein
LEISDTGVKEARRAKIFRFTVKYHEEPKHSNLPYGDYSFLKLNVFSFKKLTLAWSFFTYLPVLYKKRFCKNDFVFGSI